MVARRPAPLVRVDAEVVDRAGDDLERLPVEEELLPRHAQPAPPPEAQPTALLVAAIGAPLRVPGSDGMTHLEYDLLVANMLLPRLRAAAQAVKASIAS